MSVVATPRGYIERPRPSGLADVVDVILDKGMVIDAYVRVALVGIELLTIDARIVIASVDTYLRFAEAVNRLEIGSDDAEGLPQLISQMTSEGAESKTKGALRGAKDEVSGNGGGRGALSKVKQKLSGEGQEDDEEEDSDDSGRRRASRRSRSSNRKSASRTRSRASNGRAAARSGSGSRRGG
jgi:gas vesicle structural protein